MICYYEHIQTEYELPIKVILHCVDHVGFHWHELLEFLMPLEGSINVNIDGNIHRLNAGEFILINTNQIHHTFKTDDNNLLLALQIDPYFYSTIYPNLNELYFYCHSFYTEPNLVQRSQAIKKYLAQIVLDVSRQQPGYRSRIGSNLFLLADHIINFPFDKLEDVKNRTNDDDIERIQRITKYIIENLHRHITLKEIAEAEHISYYYLSRFIREKIGIPYREFVTHLRLEKAIEILLSQDTNIKDIAAEAGFSSPTALHKAFREQFKMTPSAYKEAILQRYLDFQPEKTNLFPTAGSDVGGGSRTYLDVNRKKALKTLFEYLDTEKDPVGYEQEASLQVIHKKQPLPPEYYTITVDSQKEGRKNSFYWRRLTSFTRAAEGLRRGWQEQLQDLQKDIGFEQVRFHGIFSDDMMVFQRDLQGNIIYNWTYVDKLIDGLLQANIRPFVELGFMPKDLASSHETQFWWEAYIAPPKTMDGWIDLVQAFIRHCLNRYGPEEVANWYFEVWNEPELKNCFWLGTKEEYFEFYQATAQAVKDLSPDSPVGGPAIAHQRIIDSNWLDDFLLYCRDNKIPLDFVSIHIYPERFSSDFDIREWQNKLQDPSLSLNEKLELLKQPATIYHGSDHTYEILQSAHKIMERTLLHQPELCVTEWNASSYPRNLIHDTAFVAAFIVHHVIRCQGLADMLGYWTFTDINEENPLGVSHFHGSFGLINKDGIKKASYYAYYLLAKLGDQILHQGDNHILTKNSHGVQILTYNYAYFDPLFLKGDISLLSNKDRYRVFEDKPNKHFNINISGLTGTYKIIKYRLNINHGSSYDQWVRMGAPEEMSPEEIKYLKHNSCPEMIVENVELNGHYQDEIKVPVHGVEMILLQKIY